MCLWSDGAWNAIWVCACVWSATQAAGCPNDQITHLEFKLVSLHGEDEGRGFWQATVSAATSHVGCNLCLRAAGREMSVWSGGVARVLVGQRARCRLRSWRFAGGCVCGLMGYGQKFVPRFMLFAKHVVDCPCTQMEEPESWSVSECGADCGVGGWRACVCGPMGSGRQSAFGCV